MPGRPVAEVVAVVAVVAVVDGVLAAVAGADDDEAVPPDAQAAESTAMAPTKAIAGQARAGGRCRAAGGTEEGVAVLME
jgi:hypothetical protein